MLKDALRAERVAPVVRAKLSGGVTAGELEGLVDSLVQAPGAYWCCAFLGLVFGGSGWVEWGLFDKCVCGVGKGFVNRLVRLRQGDATPTLSLNTTHRAIL